METKNYPENGAVVIVDDQIEEALPLMNALSKMDIAYKYFTGKQDELPATPLKNVRILFLDIELEGMQGVTEDKTKLSALANVISRIISKNCSPYIIIAWTKHDELVKELDKYLSKIKPLFILAIDKSKCKRKKNNNIFDVFEISKQLKEKINDFGVFQFFLKWQNISNASSIELINDVASIFPFDNQWNDNTGNILKMLAEAYAGNQVDNNYEEFAMLTFNNLFLDIMEKNIVSSPGRSQFISNAGNAGNVDDIKGELNRRLHISPECNKKTLPGNIYLYDNVNLKKSIPLDKSEMLKDMLNNVSENDQNNNIKLILLEVSPFCDYAQNKWKRSRLLPGIICPKNFGNKIKKAGFIYTTPILKIDNEPVYLVFNIKYLSSIPLNSLNKKTSNMRIRKELLNDIQTKIAGHINRLGITSL